MNTKKDGQAVAGSGLERLNAIMLSMGWETDDDGSFGRFIGEVSKLKALYKEDRYIFPLLQILNSVGRYIHSRKSRAHPDAVTLLNSVFETLGKVLGEGGEMTDPEKARLVSAEARRFKVLKQHLAHPVETEEKITARSLDAVMADLKKEMTDLIREEFRKLKEDLKK